jgi:LPXTG-motif cell wall-anchored protein
MLSKTVRIGAIAALAASGLVGVVAASTGTAAATAGCVPVLHNNTAGISLTAGGKATALADGLRMETPAQPDAVSWKTTLSAPVALKDITQLSYVTRKYAASDNAAALPAYRLYLEGTDGANDTATLIYEPYYQPGVGNPAEEETRTWAPHGGFWWSNRSIAGGIATSGGSYAGNQTLAQVALANPGAKVVAFGVGQGTYNDKLDARVNNVLFKGKFKCETHSWVAPAASSSSGSVSASASSSSSSKPPSQSGSASASSSSSSKPPSGSASSSSSSPDGVYYADCDAVRAAGKAPLLSNQPGYRPALDSDNDGIACEDSEASGGDGGSLPKTGDSVPVSAMVAGGAGLVLFGAGLLWALWYRRNRPAGVQFEA